LLDSWWRIIKLGSDGSGFIPRVKDNREEGNQGDLAQVNSYIARRVCCMWVKWSEATSRREELRCFFIFLKA